MDLIIVIDLKSGLTTTSTPLIHLLQALENQHLQHQNLLEVIHHQLAHLILLLLHFHLLKYQLIGLKSKSPAIAIAVTISGEATKACVFGFPSARFEKFLLNECTMVFFSSFSAPSLSH